MTDEHNCVPNVAATNPSFALDCDITKSDFSKQFALPEATMSVTLCVGSTHPSGAHKINPGKCCLDNRFLCHVLYTFVLFLRVFRLTNEVVCFSAHNFST